MDDKPLHLLKGFQASLFFFTYLGLKQILLFFKIIVIPFFGIPILFLVLFFPLWEFLFLLPFFQKKASFLVLPWLFFALFGIFFNPSLALLWNAALFLLLSYEAFFSQKKLFFYSFIILILCLFFLPFAFLFLLCSFFLRKKLLLLLNLESKTY